MERLRKPKKNAYSAEKTAEQNVRAALRKRGSYIGAAKDLDRLRNVSRKHSKAKKKFRSSEILALHKKAKQVLRGTHKSDRGSKQYASYSRRERKHRKAQYPGMEMFG